MPDCHTYLDNDLPVLVSECCLARISQAINDSSIEGVLLSVVRNHDSSSLVVCFEDALSTDDLAALSVLMADPDNLVDIDDERDKRFEEIDRRTVDKINNGFIYNGDEISASLAAQLKLTMLYGDRDVINFPIEIARKKDRHPPVNIPDQAELRTIFSYMRAHIQTCVYSGEDLKDQIRSATTVAAIRAIVDDR